MLNVTVGNFTEGAQNETESEEMMMMTELSYGEKLFLLLLSIVIFVVTNIGNGLVIQVVLSMNPAMKTFTNYLIVNKAFADIVLSFYMEAIMIDVLYPFITSEGFDVSFYYMMLFCSELTLTFITVDRFIAIQFPLRRVNKFRDHRITIPILWLLSAWVFIGNYFVTNYGDETAFAVLDYSIIVVVFFFPLLVMIILYSIICHKLWIRQIPGAGEHKSVRHSRRAKKRSQKRAIKTMVTVTVIFFIAWAPYMLNMLAFMSSDNYDVTFISTIYYLLIMLLTYMDGALAPVIYFSMSEQFQRALKSTLRKSNIVCLRKLRKQEKYTGKVLMTTAGDDTTFISELDTKMSMKSRLN